MQRNTETLPNHNCFAAMTKDNASSQRPNCFACRFFYITYEPKHPYGCRRMSFKSKQLPSVAAYVSSGMECQSFEKKEQK